MFVVDTNILVYAANRDCPEHRRCLDLLERSRNRLRHGTRLGVFFTARQRHACQDLWLTPSAERFVRSFELEGWGL
jgi:predicted nucleic acid-binding protein